MPIGSSAGEYFPDESALLVDQAKKQQAISIRPVQEPFSTTSTMPAGSPTEPAGALKPEGGTNVPEKPSETNFLGRLSMVNAAKGMLNPSIEEDKKLLTGFYDTVKNAFSLPGDVYGGKIDPSSQQGIERAADLAGLMIFGPAPVAEKMADGTLGSFAGVKSKTLNKSDLAHAQVLEWARTHPDTIWEKAGFMRGEEGAWKYEIDDSKSSFNRGWVNSGNTRHSAYEDTSALTAILDHPELYKAYPQLKDIRVVHDSKYPSTGAEWASQSKTIRMGTEAAQEHGTLMHEVQHAIQDIEGFAKGGSPGKAGEDYNLKYTHAVEALIPESEDIIKKIGEKGLTQEEYARSKYLTTVFKKYQEYKAAGNQEAAKYYLRLAGETEARNVETRLLLTERERRMFAPEHTADIPAHHQIPIDQPVITSAYGVFHPDTGKLMKSEPINFRRAANDNIPGRTIDRKAEQAALDKIDESWKKMVERNKRIEEVNKKIDDLMKKYPHSEIDKARLKKLRQERLDVWK